MIVFFFLCDLSLILGVRNICRFVFDFYLICLFCLILLNNLFFNIDFCEVTVL